MRIIELNMKEINVYQIIKRLVETNGNKVRASLKLGCTTRNINKLIKKYKDEGKAGFSHGNKLRKPKNTVSIELRNKILDLYENTYFDFNWKHFREKLEDNHNIKLAYSCIYKILTNAGYISRIAFKRTRRKKAAELKEKKKLCEIDKKVIQDHLLLDKVDSHPRKPRSKYFGELIQMDASGLIWFDDVFATLHLAVDDSTGTVVGAYFTPQETLFGYYNVFHQILSNYGVPAKFLTDNRTVFIYKHKKNPTVDEDTLTQFGYACKQLGVDIETSSVAQYKGRIERLNGTFQRRLPQELRTAKIHTIEQANEFLKSYLKKFNSRFALHINNSTSVFENKPTEAEINRTLAVIAPRIFDDGSSIKYHNKYYQAFLGTEHNIVCFRKGVKCLVIKTLDGSLYASVEEKIFGLKELQEFKKVSPEFDHIIEQEKPRVKYIPPMSHPWKHKSFMKYLSTISRYDESGANV